MIGGQIGRDNRPSIGQYLTREQTNYIYIKTESGEMINIDILSQEVEHERQLNRIDDTNREINPYRELIVNNAEKIEPLLTQMEQWSILSSMLNYIQYDKFPKNYHTLGVSTVNKNRLSSDLKRRKRGNRVRFWSNPRHIKRKIT